MCILLLTTAHPSYALILLDNRDEFILRPTSRPAWYAHPSSSDSGSPTSASSPSASTPLLSSRDLQRAEKGTWLGLTRTGHVAVLTNYRETDPSSTAHPIRAIRSRGGMVTYWLGTDPREDTRESLARLVTEGGVKGVGGFSMLCGKLRRKKKRAAGADGDEEKEEEDGIEPVAIVTNRCEGAEEVSWVAGRRGEVCVLSNAFYDDAEEWPKVRDGRRLLAEAVRESVSGGEGEAELTERLFGVLDTDTLPRHPGMGLQEYVACLKESIFIPPVGDERQQREMEEHASRGKTGWPPADGEAAEVAEGATVDSMGFETGMYGTQRQTVVLVDWDGNVVFMERALFDGNGNPIARGEADDVVRFKIEGWEGEEV